MASKKLVSIIITSYNEEKNIGSVIKDCQKLKKFFPVEIIVVDGGSRDKTLEVVKKSKVDKVIPFLIKRGKGADFWAGGLAASGEYIVQIDADHQFQPDEIPLFIDELEKGADVAIATRFSNERKNERGSISGRNLFGNWLMSFLTSIAAGRKITDVMAGFKAFKKDAFLALDLKERHFEYEAETVVKAVKMNMELVQIPITYTRRKGGESGIRAVRDGLNVSKAIAKVYLYNLPKIQDLRGKQNKKSSKR